MTERNWDKLGEISAKFFQKVFQGQRLLVGTTRGASMSDWESYQSGRPTGRPYKGELLKKQPGQQRQLIFSCAKNLFLFIPISFSKKGKKLHRSANKNALRCGYRRTVDEKNFDCGAFLLLYEDFLDASLSYFIRILRLRPSSSMTMLMPW